MSRIEGSPSFTVVAFPYIALAIFTGWFTRIYWLRWRETITINYIPRWQRVDEEEVMNHHLGLPCNDDNEKSIIEDKSSLDILIILLDTPRQNGL